MKRLAIALAIAALTAAPAFAKSKPSQKNETPAAGNPADAYAYAPNGRAPLAGQNTSQSVYVNGQYQGADPDPFIRLQLMRDPPTVQW
jgi:hypothetical protein